VPTYRDSGVVLRTHKFGEADRVVVILTREHGKVRAVARGVRKTRSSIGARLEPMSHVDVSLRSGRDLDTVAEVRLVENHPRVRADLARVQQGLSMVEAVDKMTPDREPVPEIHEMLVKGLRTLDTDPSPLVLGAFFLRLLALEGRAPSLAGCLRCGAREGRFVFDVDEGGVMCPSCGPGQPVSDAAIRLMRAILSGRVRDALAEGDTAAAGETSAIAMDAMEHHLERRLRALGSFDRHL